MAKNDTSVLRNLTFVGHGGAGKTTLCEAVLMEAGLATRLPAGIMDYLPDEKDRGGSIDSALAQFSWDGKEVTFIDTSGYQDFIHSTISALNVVETSVCVVSAADGVTVNTRRGWEESRKKGVASIVVVTKLDGENVSFDDMVSKIQQDLGERCLPFIIPSGDGDALTEVYSVLTSDNEKVSKYKEQLIESVVETDDEMLSKFFEGEEIPIDDLKKQFRKVVYSGEVFPIIVVCPTKNIGVKEFMSCIDLLCPSPADVPARKAEENGEEKTVEASADAEFSGQVFKIFNDPFGRVSYFRVFSGTLKSASTIYVTNTETTERIGQLLKTFGKEHKQVDEAVAGEIVAVAKVENIQDGDTLSVEKSKLIYPKVKYPTPMVPLAVEPMSRGDEQKISAALNKIAEEDPTFVMRREEETSELVVSGMSNLHLDIILNRLKTRFKVECSKKLPRIAYRETITGKSDSRYRHKKQSGGSGQFAEVAIKMEPTERGEQFEFVNKIVGGVIPSPYIASTEKGMIATMEKGILAGYRIVDIRVTLYDGKTHDVDSSDAAFQIAGSKAFQEAFMQSKPVLLEPVEHVKIFIPQDYMGDIMGDLNTRRGRIVGSDTEGKFQVVEAHVPLAEMLTYSADLKAITGAEGSFTMEFSHYDVVPSHLQDKIIAQAKAEQEK